LKLKEDQIIFVVKLKFKIAISLLDAIKMRFMGAKNADRIMKYILKQLESNNDQARRNRN